MSDPTSPRAWLNVTVLGIGGASFLSDVAHGAATVVLPFLAARMGSPSLVLWAVEGVAQVTPFDCRAARTSRSVAPADLDDSSR